MMFHLYVSAFYQLPDKPTFDFFSFLELLFL